VARKAGVSVFPFDRDVPGMGCCDRAAIRLIAIEENGIADLEFSGLVGGHQNLPKAKLPAGISPAGFFMEKRNEAACCQFAADQPRFCTDPAGFDRAAFHRDFNASVVRFFRDHLAGDGGVR
jgi:hypothetical protein